MNLKRALRYGLIGLIGLLFFFALRNSWERVTELDFEPQASSVLVVLVFTVAVILSGISWSLLFNAATEGTASTRSGVRAHLLAWLLKYIPGQVGALISKVHWGEKNGAKRKETVIAFAYEFLFLTIVSTYPTLPVLAVHYFDSNGYLIAAALLVTPLAVWVLAKGPLISAGLNLINKVSKSEISQLSPLTASEAVRPLITSLASRMLNGVGIVILARQMTDVEMSDYLLLGAGYVFAGIVGIWAIFVPSGLGVREGVFAAVAAPAIGFEIAIAIAIVARLYSTISDAAVALVYWILGTGETSK